MKRLYIKDIIKVTNGELVCGNSELECFSFSKDTRTIKSGDIYIGIKGETFDGNKLYVEAFAKGASACILDQSTFDRNSNLTTYENKTIILVKDTIKALQDLASYKRSLYDIPVIAVTGSVGKTSTKDMIASVISQKFKVLKTEGNYNNNIGLPLTILQLQNHDAIVLEMGMNSLGEISLLSQIAKPTIAVITNVGTAHIGKLGSRENILKAKMEILEGLSSNGTLIINNDNDMLHNQYIENKIPVKTITIGIDNKSDYMAKNIVDKVFCSEYNLNGNKCVVNVGGKAFIYNSLVAYAVGKCLDIEDKNILKGIREFKLSANRMEVINSRGFTIINDTYNANFEAVLSVIDLLDKAKYKRKILLFGDMLELDEYSKKLHTQVGEYISKRDIDYVVLVGKEVEYTASALMENRFDKDNIFHFEKENDTYKFLDKFLEDNDLILLKGSHGMNLVNIVNHLTRF